MKATDPKYTICYNAKRFCNEDISLIENYDEMMADYTQIWCCHHILEITENKSKKQLIAEGRYYNRPACELIFMTDSDHKSLHNKGKPKSDETIKKISDTMTGVPKSEEHRRNISESKRGMKFWNDGTKTVRAKECPGTSYGPGMLPRLKKASKAEI